MVGDSRQNSSLICYLNCKFYVRMDLILLFYFLSRFLISCPLQILWQNQLNRVRRILCYAKFYDCYTKFYDWVTLCWTQIWWFKAFWKQQPMYGFLNFVVSRYPEAGNCFQNITNLQTASQWGPKKTPASEVSLLAPNKEFRERSKWERGPLSVSPARPRPLSASSH